MAQEMERYREAIIASLYVFLYILQAETHWYFAPYETNNSMYYTGDQYSAHSTCPVLLHILSVKMSTDILECQWQPGWQCRNWIYWRVDQVIFYAWQCLLQLCR